MSYYKTKDKNAVTTASEYFRARYVHQRAAMDLAAEVGAHYDGVYMREGQLKGFRFTTKPEGFKRIDEDCYYPKASNKAVIDKIEKLPGLKSLDTVNKAVGFKPCFSVFPEKDVSVFPEQDGGNRFYPSPAFFVQGKTLYMEIPTTCGYTPPTFVQEIKGSVYMRAHEKLEPGDDDNG